jgi:ribosomal protein L32
MVVRMRHTRSHTRNRRSHHALTAPAISAEKGGALNLRHRASPVSGTYRGRSVVDIDKKIEKKAAKSKARGTSKK